MNAPLPHHPTIITFPSANALRVVAVLEADDRDQSNDPADWMEWTPAYRDYIARKIDRAYRGY